MGKNEPTNSTIVQQEPAPVICNCQTMTDEMRQDMVKHISNIQLHLHWKKARLECEIINTAILAMYEILDMVHHNSNYLCPKDGEAIAAAAIAKDREHTFWLLTRNGYKGAEAFLKREFDGEGMMGAGIRPKGAFPYATLRYKSTTPPCFGKNASNVPDIELCDTCVHLEECKREFYQ